MPIRQATSDRLDVVAQRLQSRERHGANLTLRSLREDLLDVIRALRADNPYHQHLANGVRSGGSEHMEGQPGHGHQGLGYRPFTWLEPTDDLEGHWHAVHRNGPGTAIRVSCCNDVIRSTSVHDQVYCSCKTTFVDGGAEYLRWGSTDDQVTIVEVPLG